MDENSFSESVLHSNTTSLSNEESNTSVNTGTSTASIRCSIRDSSFENSYSTGNTTLSLRREFENESITFHKSDTTSNKSSNEESIENQFQVTDVNSSTLDPSVDVQISVRSNNDNVESFISNNEEWHHQRSVLDSFNDDYPEHYEHDDSEYDNEDSEYEELENENEPLRYNKGFQSLFEMLDNHECNETVDTHFVVSKIEILLAILSFSNKYSLPNCATSDLCKMFNAFVSNPVIPDTRYLIDKLFYSNEGIEYHAVCPTCKTYINKFTKSDRTIHCNICEVDINLKSSSYRNYFAVLNVEDQIRHLIENNSEYFTSATCERDNDNLQDIYDGRCYRRMINSIPIEEQTSFATITFNSDGSPVFESSTFSVWPIHININEIPPDARNKPITCAIWFGRDKPNMTTFLRPFVDLMKQYSLYGICCKINEEIRNVKVYVACCCADSVARAPMQGTIQFNGRYGCNWCLHPGESIMHNRGFAIKYPLLDNIPDKRRDQDHIQMVQEALNTRKPVFGVKKASPLLTLKHFDMIDGFVPDAMHCVALGVVKQFFQYWFKSTGKLYSVAKDEIVLIDNIVSSFKVPNILARLSRSVNDFNYWKSRELENWLLYYSLPVLQSIRGFQKYAEHWEFLVQAIYILMKDSITTEEMQIAHNYLKNFVALTEHYYSKDAMTYNVHQLTHLTQSVANWGPLWAHIGYPFESANGQLIRTVHAAKGVINQICRHISMQQSIIIMDDHLKEKQFSPVLRYCYYLNHRCTEGTDKLNKYRYFGKPLTPNPTFVQQLGLSNNHTRAYHRMVKDKCLLKSRKKVCERSNNSFAFTVNNEFVEIEEFIIDRLNRKEYTICRKVIVENAFRNVCISIKKVIRIDNYLVAVETKNIQRIAVFMDVHKKRYISAIPNTYWYS